MKRRAKTVEPCQECPAAVEPKPREARSHTEHFAVERHSEPMTLDDIRDFLHQTAHLPGGTKVTVKHYSGFSDYYSTSLSVTRVLPFKETAA